MKSNWKNYQVKFAPQPNNRYGLVGIQVAKLKARSEEEAKQKVVNDFGDLVVGMIYSAEVI